ncbi:MAG TPA: hypothetical protein VEM58_08205 [Streptosporangiaceae bacterium]|nr:hypothetical protein [Streptosporangiaceae bacterium]
MLRSKFTCVLNRKFGTGPAPTADTRATRSMLPPAALVRPAVSA